MYPIYLFFLSVAISSYGMIAARKYFSETKTVYVDEEKVTIMGEEQLLIRFNDLIKYESGRSSYRESLSLWLANGKKFVFIADASAKDNALFVAALKKQIEESISIGKLPMTRGLYWPIMESKLLWAALISYTLSLIILTRNLNHPAFEIKVAMGFAFFIAFIAWYTCLSMFLINKNMVSYKRST
jgi:hypothetical protein